MDFFQKNYPKLYAMYIEYINTKGYAEHPLVNYSDKSASKVISEVAEFAENEKNKLIIDDKLVSYATDNECAGFILGFSYALKLAKKANAILKELENVHLNT